ncbi:MAG: hypothetical protein A2X35_11525 [Elusimicrobia bacterium GWA2_61_42]|nr:MAG: hypothetical protein A2X35_11525 [Elusimicrobia bacterium GWA2_61_42]OGR75834.1 MAG: hypothetical protein A2X38_07390 [Elusimicrobia bacterium GWC2_61_25]
MFKKIQPHDYRRLKPFFEGQLYTLCPYSLASMIIWSGCLHEAFYLEENGSVYLSEVDIEDRSRRRMLLPVTRPFRFLTPRELAEAARKLDFPAYHYVPQEYVDIIGAANLEGYFSVQEESGYGDYLYRTADMAHLKGRDYAKKRNLIAQFNKLSGPEARVKPMEGVCLESCLELFDHWEKVQGGPVIADIPNCERKAIVNGLTHFKELEMSGVAVELGGRLAGFAFGSRLSADTFTLNFEKADAGVKGLYQFLDAEAAKALPPQYTLLNKENDLGLSGLKKAKESYFPLRLVKSYILTLKS